MKIKGKQLENTLRTATNPFTEVHATQFVGGIDGAIRFKCKNAEVSAMSKGQAVYISGVSGDVPEVKLADADGAGTVPAVGLTESAANASAEVYVVSFGNLTGLNTSALNTTSPYASIVGRSVYVGTTPGSLTIDPPASSSAKLQNIGQIVREHSTEGIIKVGGAGRTAATPNLDEGKFFLGDSNNQSVQSSYTLPTSLSGTSGQVLSSDGTNIVLTTPSSNTSEVNFIILDANVSVSDLVSEAHYILPYDASSGYTITLPNQSSANTADFFQKTFTVENRSASNSVTITSSGTLSNAYRYYRTEGGYLASGTLNETVPPKTTMLFKLITYTANTFCYWIEYNDILAHPVEHLGNVSLTSLADRDVLEYDSATGDWVNVPSGSLTLETKTAGFSASPNYFYLVSTTAGSTFDVYVPYQTNFAVGDRIKIFNTGDGVIRLIETISGTSITPYEGTTGVYGTYRNVNSKCLVELVAINTQTWSYVIIPQLELDESTLTKTGEVFAYNLAEKAMKALPYTFPSADGVSNQVLQTDGLGVLSFATIGGGWTYSAITADPANAQAGYHYSCTGTFTITLPTSGVSAGQEIRIKNMGTGTITIDPQTQNIDGTSTDYVLDVQYSAITLVSTGSHWEII